MAFFLALTVAKFAVSVLLRYGKGYDSKHSKCSHTCEFLV